MLTNTGKKQLHRLTVYLSDDNWKHMNEYISNRHTVGDAYGAKSETVNDAVGFYCASTLPWIDAYVPEEKFESIPVNYTMEKKEEEEKDEDKTGDEKNEDD